jgi:hypothetical protein
VVALAAALVATVIGNVSSIHGLFVAPLVLVVGSLSYIVGIRVLRAGPQSQDWLAISTAVPPIMRPAVRLMAGVFG